MSLGETPRKVGIEKDELSELDASRLEPVRMRDLERLCCRALEELADAVQSAQDPGRLALPLLFTLHECKVFVAGHLDHDGPPGVGGQRGDLFHRCVGEGLEVSVSVKAR